MTERDVAALILVSATHGIEDVKRTLESVRPQSVRPACVLTAVVESATKELRDGLEAARDEGLLDLLRVYPAHARRDTIVEDLASAVEEAKTARRDRPRTELPERRHASDTQAARGQETSAPTQAAGENENAPRNFTLLNPAFGGRAQHEEESPTVAEQASEPLSVSGEAEPTVHSARDLDWEKRAYLTSGTLGRRARDINLDREERREERTATHTALVPERLREDTRERHGSSGAGRRRKRSGDGESWLWILDGAAVPSATCLEELEDALEQDPTVGLVGTKHLALDDLDRPASRLVDLGLSLTHSHRLLTSVDPGEIDQGQTDWRSEVLAVTAPGLLVRARTFDKLRGLDPALTAPWDDIDLSQRVWRAGERVKVVPSASTRIPHDIRTRPQDFRYRSSQVLSLVKFRSLPLALLTLIALPLVTLARMARAVTRHDAHAVKHEFLAFLRVFAKAPGVLLRSRKAAGRARMSRKRMSALYMPRKVAMRERLDAWWTSMFADDERTRMIRRTSWGIAGTRHGLDDADYGRHTAWTVIVALASLVGGLFAVRPLIGEGTLGGAHYLPLASNAHDNWDIVTSAWLPGGLGAEGPADLLARVMALIPVSGASVSAWILLTGIALSAIAAWCASGTVTRSIVVRIIATLAWVLSPAFVCAVLEGRWPLMLLGVAVPLAALFFARAVGLPHKVSQASIPAAAMAGFMVAIVSLVQPALAVLFFLGTAAVAPFVPGRRKRLWWVALPTLFLHLGTLPDYLARPETLLANAGMPLAFEAPGVMRLLALTPTPADPVAQILGAGSSWWTLGLLFMPAVISVAATVVSGFLRHTAGLTGRISGLALAGAVALAWISQRTVVGFEGSTPHTAYPGAALMVASGAAIVGLICVGDAMARSSHAPANGAQKIAAFAVQGLCLVALVASAGLWTAKGSGALEVERRASSEIPAVAVDSSAGAERTRTLVLHEDSHGEVRANLVNGAHMSVDDSSAAYETARARAAERGQPSDAAEDALAQAVASALGSEIGAEAKVDLADFAIGYVVVMGEPGAQTRLYDALAAAPQLDFVTSSDMGGLWRVAGASPRAHLTAASGANGEVTPLNAERTRVTGTVDASNTERELALAVRSDPHWRATLDGEELRPTILDTWKQGFIVPAGEHGHLEVSYRDDLQFGAGIVAVVGLIICALAAVPRRNRSEEKR
ncbi:glycosyltransferase [Dermabacter vaginalis]|uniref:glycosyltransferase n=1 Tax=Dermabacter vaginalis TaxID=1630135 RepID=UPI001EF44F43|nr:glycosyltransferase [Dermabacter vaginalis]MCG7443009.1 glycosyltransferase [Dermabacter vaginalis]